MMQFGIFSVGDVTPDPTTGRAPTEAERIQSMVAIALKAELVNASTPEGLITCRSVIRPSRWILNVTTTCPFIVIAA